VRRPTPAQARRATRKLVDRGLAGLGFALVDYDPTFANALVDRSAPLPATAAELRDDNPRLLDLQRRYAELDWPVCEHSGVWDPAGAKHGDTPPPSGWRPKLDLQYFRGDNSYVWHYRESRRTSELKYFIYLEDVRRRDRTGLLERLDEDGAFGCWSYQFAGRPRCSRDQLDAINELLFLEDHLGVLGHEGLRVLDIGAGYGRLAHRFAQAASGLIDYCCADAVPTSTFLCEWYTRFRGVSPPVRVAPLPEVPELTTGGFDLACNVHAWSECTSAAIGWWVGQLARLEVPRLFVVPNEPEGFLSLEADGSRRDYLPMLEAAGYRLAVEEPALPEAAVRELLPVHDRYCLFERTA
jgi:SAM-dependent methyltransferase